MNRLPHRTALLSALTAGALAMGGLAAAGPAGARPVQGLAKAPAAAHGSTVHGLAPRAAALAAAPVGRLSTTTCSENTGAQTASCDLWAMTGTTQVVGTNLPIWGFSPTGAAGSATNPGPLLVVHQGDAVSVTLHNQLAQAVSVALPGQVGVQHDGVSGDDLVGVDTGQTRTYTFTASRPGTFLYSAGHTPNGARQVAMGLAGALVVLPTTPGTAYGAAANTDTGYDDEAVLVLGEIDPRLNADPTGFDMRSFRPAYRLINGKAYPGTDPISTDQGHTVLLRYVNAGAQLHAMSLLGAAQTEIGQDGHPAAYTTTVTAESISPGETLDTLVHIPTGPDAKFAVFENSQHLDNAGATTPGGLQLPFGGMLTFLDTNAPPPATDAVGPTSTQITGSPNPADGQHDVTVTATVSDARTGGAYVDHAEFVVDDPTIAVGSGTPMVAALPAGGTSTDFSSLHQVTVAGVTGTIPAFAPTVGNCTPDVNNVVPLALECLSAGTHHVYVRAHDVNGNWGVIGSMTLNLPKTGPQTTNGSVPTPANGSKAITLAATGDDTSASGVITAAEYFIDTVGTPGTGTAMTLNRSAAVVAETASIPAATVAGLTEGTHHLFVRSQDNLGLWGPTLDVPLDVDLTGPRTDAVAMSPMASNGVVSDPSNPGYARIAGSVTDVAANGSSQNLIVAAEAFFDHDPGLGKGIVMRPVDGKLDSNSEAVYALVPLTQLKAMSQGQHQLFLRGKDNAGNWGSANTAVAAITIDRTAPVLSAFTAVATATPNMFKATANYTEQYSSLDTAEYWFGTTDPGAGNGTPTTMDTTATGKVSITADASSRPVGVQALNMRVKDKAGNWSNVVSTNITVTRPNIISANSFEPGAPALPVTGTATRTTASKVPTSWEPGSTQGLSVAGTSYVTDPAPIAEPAYHARFAFKANTLATGTNAATVVTLLQARTGTAKNTGNEVFAVQFHKVGTGAQQVRLVLDRSTGTPITGAWVTIGTGAVQIQVDWTPNSAVLTVVQTTTPTTTKYTLTTTGNTYRVETVNLGLIAPGAGTTGTAFLDSFSSGRNSAA